MFFNYGVGANGKTVLMSTVSGILGDYCKPRPSRRSPRARATGTRPNWRGCAARGWSPRPRPRRTALGGKPPQGIDRRRADRRALHAQGLLRIPADVQARHLRQPQAAPAQRRRRDAAAGQHDPVRGDDPAGRARPPTRREAEGRMAGHPAMDDRRLPRLAGARPRAAGGRHQGDRRLFRGGGRLTPTGSPTAAKLLTGLARRSSELFASWRDYAEKAGLQAGDTKRFREEMERLGYPLKHNKTGNYYVGLRIRQDQPEGAYDGR